MSASRVGFIGLGNMGQPLAASVARAGFGLLAYDAAGVAERAPADAQVAASALDVGMAAEIVVLSLPGPSAVTAVTAELADARRQGGAVSLVIDTSTIGIAASRATQASSAEAGIDYLDSPVSGGVAGAVKRTLVIMCAGPERVCAAAKPVLDAMSVNVFQVGGAAGAAQAVKLANNFLSATAVSATSEAIAFVESCGVDPSLAIEVINRGTGRNTASEDKFPNQIFTGRFAAGFTNTLMNKDLRLFSEAATKQSLPGPVRSAICDEWERFTDGAPGADVTVMYTFVKQS